MWRQVMKEKEKAMRFVFMELTLAIFREKNKEKKYLKEEEEEFFSLVIWSSYIQVWLDKAESGLKIKYTVYMTATGTISRDQLIQNMVNMQPETPQQSWP